MHSYHLNTAMPDIQITTVINLTLSGIWFVSILVLLLHLGHLAPLLPLGIAIALVRSWNPDTALRLDLFPSLVLKHKSSAN